MGISLFSLCLPLLFQDLSQKYLGWLYHMFILHILERSRSFCISRMGLAGGCSKSTSLARVANRFPRQGAKDHCAQRGYSWQIIGSYIRMNLEITALYTVTGMQIQYSTLRFRGKFQVGSLPCDNFSQQTIPALCSDVCVQVKKLPSLGL